MILIGQYDSSYVRRVAIALTLYGLDFEHRPWSTFADAARIAPFNPLLRVPVLVLDDGDVLTDSHAILDYIDSLVGEHRRLYPSAQPERRRAMAVATLATGFADKAVSLFYEQRLHATPAQAFVDRCRTQMRGVLDRLERDRAGRPSLYWFSADKVSHADIAVACALRHGREAHPDLVGLADWPALAAHADRMEGLAVFRSISQPLVVPI